MKVPSSRRWYRSTFDSQLFAAIHGRGFISGLTLVVVTGLCILINKVYFQVRLFDVDGRLVIAVALTWSYCFGVIMASLIWSFLLLTQAALRTIASLVSRKPPTGMFLTPQQLDGEIRRFAAFMTLLILAVTLPLTVSFLFEVLKGGALIGPVPN